MNDLNFSELQHLLEQLKTLKAKSETDPALLTSGLCARVPMLWGRHMLDWPKHSGERAYPIRLESWELSVKDQYYSVLVHRTATKLARQYVELRKELLDFLINKTEKEISERQEVPIWGLENKNPENCRIKDSTKECGCGLGQCLNGLIF